MKYVRKLEWVKNNNDSQFTVDDQYMMYRTHWCLNGKRYSTWSFEGFVGYNENGFRVYKTIKEMPYLKDLKRWANRYMNGLEEPDHKFEMICV